MLFPVYSCRNDKLFSLPFRTFRTLKHLISRLALKQNQFAYRSVSDGDHASALNFHYGTCYCSSCTDFSLLCYRLLLFIGPLDSDELLTPESLDFSLKADVPPRAHKSSIPAPPSSPFFVSRLTLFGAVSWFILRAFSTRFKISLEH